MDTSEVEFNALSWQAMAPGARHKMIERGGKRLRLVELTGAFVDPEWHRAKAGSPTPWLVLVEDVAV